MALVKKHLETVAFAVDTKSNALASREAEAQRKKARTLAKQQQAAERIAAATTELASGINEASSAAEELKRASDQIAAGAELIKCIRGLPGFRFTPLVTLTTESQAEKRDEGKRLGATGWIVKSIAATDLIAVIKKLVPGA
jgi:DNA-binding NarL/FixJ family response regulator